jgi:hypothetical protein
MATMRDHTSPAARASRRRSRLLAVFAAVAAGLAAFISTAGSPKLTFISGTAAGLLGAYACFWTWLHPKVYLGKGIALLSFLVSLILAYESASVMFQKHLWEKLFQLNGPMLVYSEPEERWSILQPLKWTHETHNSGAASSHIFRPSKVSPAMYVTVTRQPQAGTSDLELIIDGYFRGLPERENIQILEKMTFETAQGFPAVRVSYVENSDRMSLKNEIVFLSREEKLFVIMASAASHWFDRHKEIIEKILYSFAVAG